VISFKPLPVLSILAIAALAVLVSLGRWQWQRYDEKVAAFNAPVAEMTLAAYTPAPDGLQLVYGVRDGAPGWRVFAPVRTGDAIVFVDADFVPGPQPPRWSDLRVPSALTLGAPIRGAPLRPAGAAPFAAPPRPLERIWYHIDLEAMGRAARLSPVADYYLAAPYVGDDGRTEANPFARAGGGDPLPPERHLGYAVTWFGLALMLVGVYIAYHISVGRLALARKETD